MREYRRRDALRRLPPSCDRALTTLLAVVLLGSTFYVAPAVVQATGSDPIRYTYDADGRLSGVIDPAAGSAAYGYDPAGNITSITRGNTATVAVLEVAPDTGTVATSVAIDGTGFSATPSQDTVRFNGTAATVTSATSTHLVATVPAGATSGPISVTTPAGAASSPTPFTIAAGAPTITGFSPSVGTIARQ